MREKMTLWHGSSRSRTIVICVLVIISTIYISSKGSAAITFTSSTASTNRRRHVVSINALSSSVSTQHYNIEQRRSFIPSVFLAFRLRGGDAHSISITLDDDSFDEESKDDIDNINDDHDDEDDEEDEKGAVSNDEESEEGFGKIYDDNENDDEEDEKGDVSNDETSEEDIENISDDHVDDDEEDEKGAVSNDDDTDSGDQTTVTNNNNTTASSQAGPIKLVVKTGLNCPLIDQMWESTCSRTRTVASVKQSLSRQMPGRPPMSIQRLLLNGVLLDNDNVTLDSIIQAENDDEDDDDNDDDDEEGMIKLQLTLDIPPPIDAKFATDYRQMFQKMTRKELIQAYATNLAANTITAESLLSFDNEEEEEEEDSGSNINSNSATSSSSVTLTIRKRALLIEEQLLSTLSEEIVKSIEENVQTEEEESLESSISSSRKGGGAAMNVKLAMQRNLNCDWPDTIRNFLLFLFFGFFGGKDPISRVFLLTAAPMCFILQARPVKLLLKQLFYAIGTPPPIILSLLPAPQQAIMSLDYDAVVEDLYGITTSISNSQEEEEEEESEPEEDQHEIRSEEEEEDDDDYE